MTRKFIPAAALLTLCVAPLAAQPEEHETVTGERKIPASLRAWIFPGSLTQPVTVSITPAGTETTKALAFAKDGATVSRTSYEQIPPGSMRVDLKSGDEVLASKTGNLREEAHYTVLAWNNGGRWELQVFNDDLSSPNAADRPLRVLNFAQGRDTTIALDNGAENPVAKDSVQEMKLPGKVTLVTARVKSLDGGPPAQSSVEIDFASSPSAYVVVGPDYRGRMRPRVLRGGPLPEEPSAPVGSGEVQR